ncbi:GNAT family N-acetyltransferase [Denitrobaculum tricleocarpae]|uniref:GNAT family N-acetyltransferase n=1 Tax=Denitrobaculum tricleocarpae TaxID=2591009 RepID=A0A545TKX1_9PROT|nr:GNAT family N-acetyltransferase [Denitrobaculum tricleocarpae]TQV77811.1 GNAT family N-acetyltransferase [Denitrobaculum tricleocarpae]
MARETLVRPPLQTEFDPWLRLWEGYNSFYKRSGPTAVPAEVTRTTWARFFDATEPVHALVAERDGALVGLVHFIFHRNTTMLGPTCYLQDLFTDETTRGQGVGRALITAVYDAAQSEGGTRVYWHTHETNETAMQLYDKIAVRPGFVMYRQDF